MKPLGKVVSISKRRVTIKLDKDKDLVKLGTDVFDSGERHVGAVIDVIGKTKTPYLIIRATKDTRSLKGEQIYY